ncbi:MAG: Cytochrome c-555 [Gammaproteobacteria bacterium]|nr:Cytochrome c-555 [Gammaproteobacteria bacterium]
MRKAIIFGSVLGAMLTAGPVSAADGKAVYDQYCMACHAKGVNGAQKFGDSDAWDDSIAKGLETLYEHVINGFQGEVGVMPAKGGFGNLSDEEVKAAVDYMLENAQ